MRLVRERGSEAPRPERRAPGPRTPTGWKMNPKLVSSVVSLKETPTPKIAEGKRRRISKEMVWSPPLVRSKTASAPSEYLVVSSYWVPKSRNLESRALMPRYSM